MGFPANAVNLFFFPMLAIAFFVSFYLYKESAKDDEERLKKGLTYIAEDMEAEKWIKNSFAPDTLTYIKANRWIVIVYSFIFLLVVTFLWSYLTSGFLPALRNFAYAGILFWSFIMYVLLSPYLYDFVENLIPKKIRRIFNNDWVRGYIFLLPITFFVYVLFPYETVKEQFLFKFSSFPLFFFIYSTFFVCVYCLFSIYVSIRDEEKKQLEKEVKKMIEKEKS